MRAFPSFIQHESLEIISIPNVTTLSLFDTDIGFKDPHIEYFMFLR